MAKTFRRIFRKPPNVDDGDWKRLTALLAEAVERQRQIARESPNVLDFLGELLPCEDGSGCYIEHEPATAMGFGGLFDSNAPVVPPSQLLAVTTAVFGALRASLDGGQNRGLVHGAVCPGILLFAPDGVLKVTDFGFAGAVCAVLGEDAYVDLAVEVGTASDSDATITGVWEVLHRDELERDGRICAFIDPEKYGSRQFSAFEPASDVISAAFVLHLLAEHQHPYLSNEPGAHRCVEISEFMAMGRYNQARRPELRTSDDPGIRLWCDLMSRALSRLPQSRPPAGEIADALAEHIKPEDESDALRRELESAEGLVKEKNWDQLHLIARSLAENPGAPADVVQRANALASHAKAALLVDEAGKALDGEAWPEAADHLQRALTLPGIPDSLADRARTMRDLLTASLAARQTLDEIEAQRRQNDGSNPFATVELMQVLLDRMAELQPHASLVAPVHHRAEELQRSLSEQLKEAMPAAQGAMEADRAVADQWIDGMEAALAADQWDALAGLLSDRPSLRYWPEQTLARAEAVQRKLDDREAEQQRLAAVESDYATAQLWADQLRLAVNALRWDRVGQLIEARPKIEHWPDGLLDEAEAISQRIEIERQHQEEARTARAWCAKIRQAVQDGEDARAADLLSDRPVLEAWPADVLDEIGRYEKQLAVWIDAAQKRRDAEEQQQKDIDNWLQRANLAIKNEQWQEALDVLDAPPSEALADDVQHQADELRQRCTSRLADQARDRLSVRRRAVEASARDFVHDVAGEHFASLIDPGLLDVSLDDDQEADDQDDRAWAVTVRVRAGSADGERIAAGAVIGFHFRIDDASRRIRDDDGMLAGMLCNKLTELLGALQKSGFSTLNNTFRSGLFPKSEITVMPGDPVPRIPATLRLLGAESSIGRVETELIWDTAALRWGHRDGTGCIRAALAVARDVMANELTVQLLDGADALGRYRSMLAIETRLPPDLKMDRLPREISLEAAVVLRGGGGSADRSLNAFPAQCRKLGETTSAADMTQVIASLHMTIVAAQTGSLSAIQLDLEERIDQGEVSAKLTCQPNRSDEPRDRVTFQLATRGRPNLELIAVWDDAAWAFHMPDKWELTLESFLAMPTDAAPSGAIARAAILAQRLLRDLRRRNIIIVMAVPIAIGVLAIIWSNRPQNRPPIARAGSDQVVSSGATVTLDASNSKDPEGSEVTYLWTQEHGLPVALSARASARLVFVAPKVDGAESLSFRVRVSDGKAASDDDLSVTVHAINLPPTASAGEDQTVEAGSDVTLDASGSADPEHARLTYAWSKLGGPEVALTGANTVSPTFAAPEVSDDSTLTFEVSVSDGANQSTEQVTIRVMAKPEVVDPIIAWTARFQGIDGRFDTLKDRLGQPAHADLMELNRAKSMAALAADLTALSKDLPEQAGELKQMIGDRLGRLDAWQARLDAYVPVFDIAGKPLADQMRLVETARQAWPTKHVVTLMAAMEQVSAPLRLAERMLNDGDWRAAKYHAKTARAAAGHSILAGLADYAVADLEGSLTRNRREHFDAIVDEATTWVGSNSLPDSPLERLAAFELATQARGLLDRLDLDWPASGHTTEASGAAKPFPWSILTDQERATVIALKQWVTITLPIRSGSSDSAASLDLTFVPSPKTAEMPDPIWMSRTEVTVGQYRAVLGKVPGHESRDGYLQMVADDAHPVAFVPAGEVGVFCRELRDSLGEGLIVRVPTVAEWKHALRCGLGGLGGHARLQRYLDDGRSELDPTRVNFESDEQYALAAPGHNDGFGWYAPVGSYPENRWHLCDMLGNVSEWVSKSIGGRLEAIGGSFRDADDGQHDLPSPHDEKGVYDDVGMRIIVYPTPP